jgi:hypothetical protein
MVDFCAFKGLDRGGAKSFEEFSLTMISPLFGRIPIGIQELDFWLRPARIPASILDRFPATNSRPIGISFIK